MRNSSQMISRSQIAALFKRFDSKGDGTTLSFEDYYEMLKYKSQQENQKVIDISSARFFFTGAALNKSTEITQNEMEYLFSALNSPDPVEFATLLFKCIDKKREGTIGADEIQDALLPFPEISPITTLLRKALQEIEGTEQRLNFARYIELTTGEVIDCGYDPYGTIRQSKCCFFI